MKSAHEFEKFVSSIKLLPHSYRKLGYIFLLLTLAVPFVIFSTKALINWRDWALTVIYYPIAIGLALVVFSKEKVDDEFVSLIRFRSFIYGVYMFTFCMLAFPLLSNVKNIIGDQPIMPRELGTGVAALTILLLCVLISFRTQLYFSKKLLNEEHD